MVKYRDDARLFVEAAEEWGEFDVTREDAAWACRPYSRVGQGPEHSDGGYQRCVTAALAMLRPGRCDR